MRPFSQLRARTVELGLTVIDTMGDTIELIMRVPHFFVFSIFNNYNPFYIPPQIGMT